MCFVMVMSSVQFCTYSWTAEDLGCVDIGKAGVILFNTKFVLLNSMMPKF